MSRVARVERSDPPLHRRLAAIAFLDVVGYSRRMTINEEMTVRDWSSLRCKVIEPRVHAWHGRVVDRAGDGLFVEFGSALDAFRWAVEVQEIITVGLESGPSMQVRIALHLGDVIDGPDGEVQGDGVNTAARLQSYAEPGGVVVSQAVADEVRGKTEVTFTDIGALRLKNIARPVRAFRLTDHTGTRQTAPVWRRYRMHLTLTPLILLLLVGPFWNAFSGPAQRAASPDVSDSSVVRRAEATRLFNEAFSMTCPSNPCTSTWLAQRKLYEQAIATDPTFAPPYARAAITHTNFVTSGLTLNEAEDRRAAERFATYAAALAPELAVTHAARAAVLRLDPTRLEDALAAYLRSLHIDPNQPVLRANAGWMLILLGRPAEGEPYLQGALEAAPDNVFAPAWLTYLGLAELFMHRPDYGAGSFRSALARQPKTAAAAHSGLQRSLNLAGALALSGAVEEGRALVDSLRAQHPALSVRSLLNCDCSKEPGFVSGFATLRRGVMLAGVPDPQ